MADPDLYRQKARDQRDKLEDEGRERVRRQQAARNQKAHRSDAYRAAWQRRRARLLNVANERIVSLLVFERDEWVCGICEESIPQAARHPDQLSASLDHVVPLSKGGSHLYSNVRASHLGCNIRRGNREEGEHAGSEEAPVCQGAA